MVYKMAHECGVLFPEELQRSSRKCEIQMFEVPILRNPSSVRRCFGPTENPFFTEVLNTSEAKQQAFDLILQEVFQVDPTISAPNIVSDSVSKVAFKDWLIRYLHQTIIIGCYSYPERNLVAVDILSCRQFRASPLQPSKFTGEAYGNFISILLSKYLNIIHKHVKAFCQKIDQNNHYLCSLGVFTKRLYRFLEVKKEMIFTRKLVAKDLGIEVIASEFVGEEMQGIAKALKYKDLYVLTHEEMLQLGLKESIIREEFHISIMAVVRKFKREIDTRKIKKTRLRKNEVAGAVKVLSTALVQPPSDDSDVNDD